MGIADTWTATASGLWTDAGNWSGGVPGPQNDAIFPGTIALTSTFDTTGTINSVQGGANETLAVIGGTLALVDGGNWAGTVDATAGTFDVLGGSLNVNTVTLAAGATALVQQGDLLSITGTGVLAGTLGGSGEVSLSGAGSTTLAAGLNITAGTLQVIGSTTTAALGGSLEDDGIVTLLGGATLALGGATFTLLGPDFLGGVVRGPGTLAAGNAVLYGLDVVGGAVLRDTGTLAQDNNVTMGGGTADTAGIVIGAGDVYVLGGDYDITANGAATISNAGLFEKTASTGQSLVEAAFSNAGTLLVPYGTLSISGAFANSGSVAIGGLLSLSGSAVSLSGSISGAGELDLRGGGTYTLGASLALDVGTLALFDNLTTVTLDSAPTITTGFTLGASATLVLDGETLTLPQAVLEGVLVGPGTVSAASASVLSPFLLGGGATLVDTGIFTLSALFGSVQFGTGTADSATLLVQAGATLAAPTDTSLTSAGTGAIDNAGLISKTGLTSTSTLGASIVNAGTIQIGAGTLALSGGTSTLGGSIGGAGELDLRGGGIFVLQNTLALSAATLSVLDANTKVELTADRSYGGAFTLGGGATLGLGGHIFTLSDAATLSGAVQGAGTLIGSALSVAGLTLTGGATLDDGLGAVQTGNLSMGLGTADISGVVIGASSTYDILDAGNIQSAGTATISNAGLFEKTGYDAADTVAAALNSTGTVRIDAGDLALTGGGTLGGTITGAGELDLSGGGTYALQPAVAVNVGTLGALLASTVVRATSGGTIAGSFMLGSQAALQSTGLQLNSAFALNGILETGPLVLAGTGEVGGLTVTQGATLDDEGSVVQDSPLQLGTGAADAAALVIAAGATYDIFDTPNIGASGTASVANAGLFASLGHYGDNPTAVEAAFSNTGSVNVAGGALSFSGAFTNSGLITVSRGSLVVQQAAGGSGGMVDVGQGGVVDFAGTVTGQTFAFTGTAATLELGNPNAVAAAITGFVAGDTVDLTGIRANGFSLVGSALTLTQTNSGTVVAAYTLNLPGVTGTLAIANDGAGGTDVVLDHTGPVFTSNPGMLFTSTWTNDSSGAWTTGLNWATEVLVGMMLTIEPVVPTSADDVSLYPTTGTNPFDVTYNTTGTVDSLEGPSFATLELNGGTLTVNGGGVLNGAVAQAAGMSLDAVSGLQIEGGFTQASGAIDEVDSVALAVSSGTLAGTVEGSGNFYLIGASNITIEPGFTISARRFELGVTTSGFGSMTTLDTDLAYAGSFFLDNVSGNPATLDLNGHTLTLSGTAGLYGLINGAGTVSLTGSAELSGVQLQNNMLFADNGSVVQDSVIVLGGSSADTSAISVAHGDTWDITANQGINAAGAVSITNAGLFEKTISTGAAFIDPNFVTTGTLLVATGALVLNGVNSTLGGTIEGAGDLVLRGGGSFTIEPGVTITVATLDLAVNGDGFGSFTTLDTNLTYAGRFSVDNYSGNPAFLLLNGNTLTLTGPSTFNGEVEGGGTVIIDASAILGGLQLVGSAVLQDNGTITQDSLVSLGTTAADMSSINIAAGKTYDLISDTGINSNGSVSVNNSGLFEKTGGANTSNIFSNFLNNGTIAVDTGTMTFYSGEFGGTVEGPGAFGLGIGNFTIDPGFIITTPDFFLALNLDGFGATVTLDTNLSYAGAFQLLQVSGNPTFLLLNGHTASFTGSNDLFGVVQGSGTLTLGGPTEISGFSAGTSEGSVDVEDTGSVDQNGGFNLNGTLHIHSAVNWNLRGNATTNTQTAGLINNAGTIEQTVGNSQINVALDNTGSILIDEGVLSLNGTQVLGGTVAGAGTLDIVGASSVTFEAGMTLAVGAVNLLGGSTTLQQGLDSSSLFSISNATLLLGGNNLTLTGTSALGGEIVDAGTVSMSNGEVNQFTLTGGLLLDDTGTVVQVGAVNFGTTSTDSNTLDIGAGRVWHIISGGGFNVQGTAEIINQGTFLRDGVSGADYYYGSLVNSGTMAFGIGANVLANTWMNDGAITLSNAQLQVNGGGTLTANGGDTGTINVGPYGTLIVAGTLDATQTIDFATAAAPTPQDGAGLLTLDAGILAGGFFNGAIENFAGGDTIDLGTVATALGEPSAGMVQVINGGTTVGTLSLTEAPGAGGLTLVPSGASDTLLEVACFAAGTRIATERGEIAVEALRIGEPVRLASGGTAPVQWLGHRTIDCRRHPRPQDVLPVRVCGGAFGDGQPVRDLRLSPDHAVFIYGVLIPIRYLINGATVLQEPVAEVTYYHIELPSHEVILAEGLPVESYLDLGNRGAFENGGGALELHPDFASRVWNHNACAELIFGGPVLAAVRQRLLLQAGWLGHATTDDPGLRVLANGHVLPVDAEYRTYRVLLPPVARGIRIFSRRWVPAHMRPAENDHRRLGVAISRLWVDRREVSLDSPGLTTGWHDPEPERRWTDGDARLTLAGARELAFDVVMTGSYWCEDDGSASRIHMAS